MGKRKKIRLGGCELELIIKKGIPPKQITLTTPKGLHILTRKVRTVNEGYRSKEITTISFDEYYIDITK
jgi:hypothetical protein